MSESETEEILEKVAADKKWVVVISNNGAEIHEGLLGRTITVLPFTDRHFADVICKCFNAHDRLRAQRQKLLDACKNLPEPKDILAEAAYTGGDVPKKWIKERDLFIDGYNQALKDVAALRKQAIAEAESEV